MSGLNQAARLITATAFHDVRVDCPDCHEGRNEFGRTCDTCGGASFWMADSPDLPAEEAPWQAGARMLAEMKEKRS